MLRAHLLFQIPVATSKKCISATYGFNKFVHTVWFSVKLEFTFIKQCFLTLAEQGFIDSHSCFNVGLLVMHEGKLGKIKIRF